jgi:hypothetical protein
VTLQELDRLAAAIQRIGQQGSLPKDGPQALLVDELQRQLSQLKEGQLALLQELRVAPRHGVGSYRFTIDARPTSDGFNVLTTTEADDEGLGAVAGTAIFRHGAGIPLPFWDQKFFTLADKLDAIGLSATQAARTGGWIVYKWDNNRTVFQLDEDAQMQEAVITVSCSPIRQPLSAPNRLALAGATAPDATLVDAGTIPRSELP